MPWNGNERGKNKGHENLKATIPNTDYDRSKTSRECGMLQIFVQHNNTDARETESRIGMAKEPFNTRKTLVTSKLDLNLRKKLTKCHIWSIALYDEETWDFSDSRSKIPGKF